MTDKKHCVFEAKDENLEEVQDFVRDAYLSVSGDESFLMSLDLVVEEIFINIAHYAYNGEQGTADVAVWNGENGFCISFSDNGVPFNPLARSMDDVNMLAESEQIGGLGIYLVRRFMNEVTYAYENGHNILTLVKYLAE